MIPTICEETVVDGLLDSLWTTIERVSNDKISRKNPRDHVGEKWLPVVGEGKGIISEPSALSHCKAVWDVRKMLAPYFAQIYGTGDLWCSFDRINIMPDAKYAPTPKVGQWMHTD